MWEPSGGFVSGRFILLLVTSYFNYVHMLFTVVLLLYLVLTPVIPQMQYAGMPLLLSAFALRTLYRMKSITNYKP